MPIHFRHIPFVRWIRVRVVGLAVVLTCLAPASCTTTKRSGARLAAASGDGLFAKELDAPMGPYKPTRLTVAVGASNLAGFAGDTAKAKAMEGMGPLENGSMRDFFFVIFWSTQGTGDSNRPRHAHTFATYIRVRGQDLKGAPIETLTVSWLPADGKARLAAGVERAKFYDFEETLAHARKSGYEIRRTPVHQILPDIYRRAVAYYLTMEKAGRAGQASYRAVDNDAGRQRILSSQQGGFTNGIHAVSDAMAGSAGLLETGIKRGFEAGDAVFDYFLKAGAIMAPTKTYDAVLGPRLGL